MTDTTNLLAGTATVTANGISMMIAGQFKYSTSTVKRETLTGMDGVHGYKETPISGFIGFQARDAGSLSVTDLNGQTNVTVAAILANGKTIIGTNMWTVNNQEVDAENATFDVRWEGLSVTEN